MNYIKTEKLKIYNIDKFETNIKNLEDTCPKLKFEFDYYIQQIKFIQNKSYQIEYQEITSQFFEQEFNHCFLKYTLKFSIDKAIQIISKNNKKPEELSIDNVDLSKATINQDKLQSLKLQEKQEPIIVATNFIEDTLIIDGIHRTYLAKTNNKNRILAYKLNLEETLECLVSDYHRMLYIISYNISQIVKMAQSHKLKYIHFSNKKTKYGIIQMRTDNDEIRKSRKELSRLNIYRRFTISLVVLFVIILPVITSIIHRI